MSIDTEERVVVDVDLDAVLPCNVRRQQDCNQPADWVWHCPKCGNPAQPCDPHRIQLDQWVADHGGAYCPCGAVIPVPVPWSPL